MNRRFIPPAIEVLLDASRSDAAFEVARAREEGYAEGLRIGRHEGHLAGLRHGEERAGETYRAELSKLREAYFEQHSIEVVRSAFQELLAAREEARRDLEAATRVAIVGALRTLFPTLLAQAAGQEIAALVTEALSERGVEGVTLRSHPETIASVKKQGLSGTSSLTLLSDPGMPPGEAVATWSGGGLGFDPAALFEQVAGILCPDSQHKEAIRA
jgi:flagellar biosynthesis/type III secretory pathway protein FliH